jgi:hypothetical protein
MGATIEDHTDSDSGCTSQGWNFRMAFVHRVPGSQAEFRDYFTLFFNTTEAGNCP